MRYITYIHPAIQFHYIFAIFIVGLSKIEGLEINIYHKIYSLSPQTISLFTIPKLTCLIVIKNIHLLTKNN